MKRVLCFMVMVLLSVSLVACGGGGASGASGGDSKSGDSDKASGPAYSMKGDFEAKPAKDYPLIAAADFQAAFDKLYQLNGEGKIKSYKDIVDLFGQEGAYYEEKDYNGGEYKYYGWFSDDEKKIIVTFKPNGDKLNYFAYTGNISPSN